VIQIKVSVHHKLLLIDSISTQSIFTNV